MNRKSKVIFESQTVNLVEHGQAIGGGDKIPPFHNLPGKSRILVVLLGRIGDVIFTLPSIIALKQGLNGQDPLRRHIAYSVHTDRGFQKRRERSSWCLLTESQI